MTSIISEAPSDATEEVRSCANCRKDTNDEQPCTGCVNAPAYNGGALATTWFCSYNCQVEHGPRHRAACRAAECRRTLYRAARTTQLIFQRCREVLSDIAIAEVERRGQALNVYEASNIEREILPTLSSIVESDDDKQAAISCMASSTAVPFVRGLLEHMIPELLLCFARVVHTVQTPPRRVIIIQPDGTMIDNATQPHSILQITLKNLETSVIDITGVQYGYHDPVVPWDIYRHSRLQEVIVTRPLPSLADDQWQIQDDEEYQFVASLVEAVKEWEGSNCTMQYVLTGGWSEEEAEYLEWRDELVEHVDRWVKDYAAKKEEAGTAGVDYNQ